MAETATQGCLAQVPPAVETIGVAASTVLEVRALTAMGEWAAKVAPKAN